MSQTSVIGLGALAGAGKGELSEQLIQFGVDYMHIGTVVRSTAQANGFIPENDGREAYLPFWGEYAQEHGQDWLSKLAFERAKEIGRPVLLDGVRIPADAEVITASPNGLMCWLEADIETIADRAIRRARADDLGLSREDFIEKMQKDLSGEGSFSMGAVRDASELFLLRTPEIDDLLERATYYHSLAQHVLAASGMTSGLTS